ncbi:MAG: fasciclin domain-containing protein [Caulobacteraceae bacterium]
MSALSVVSVADRAGFHVFASALRSSDYFDKLEGAGPFTVFAPSDAAFKRFSQAALDKLLNDDRELLHVVLGYHFAAGKVATARLAGKRIRAVMQAGGDVIIDGRSGLRVNAARLVKPDLNARNGVVHGIDALLWPRQAAATVAVS